MPASSDEHDAWILVFDGDCGFCRYTVEYARAVTDAEAPGRIRYEPYQSAASAHPDVPLDAFKRSIQLFTSAGRFEGAEAAFRVLALAPRLGGWWWCYRRLPFFASLTEALYGFTSRHRVAMYRLARPLFGQRMLPAEYERTSALISRGIGLAALCAFLSWWSQAAGLVGSDGILPLARYFDAAAAQLGAFGWLQLPSLYWLSSADWMTTAMCITGVLASLGLLFRVRPALAAILAYACYMSLEYGGQEFMQFQWDALLVETLFLAMVLNIRPRTGIWVGRLLVFRFMLLSGAVKLLSGDPTWRALSALDFHFETQPLPTVVAWYAHQLPHSVLHAGVAATLLIELALPFLIFMPRNLRLVAAAGFFGIEVLILATGNYNFFNLLTVVMCLALLDDRVLHRDAARPRRHPAGAGWRAVLVGMGLLGALQIHATLSRSGLPPWEIGVLRATQPWQLVNHYGLFAVMTTQRNELVVEGSMDGQTWRELPFRFKPQRLDEAPRWVTPHQPRLDWQMWFAALTVRQGAPWFDDFVTRLLLGSPPVAGLLAPSPFADRPPRFVRVLMYRYRFTTFAERRASGNWWRREYLGVWYPAARLREVPNVPGLGD
jgi:predicted DCC family thiol-disulfide oxidoreductase YuxK